METHVSGQSNSPVSKPVHALDYEAVARELVTNAEVGLKAHDAQQRLEQHGPNELGDGGGVQPIKILLRQFANAMNLVLILACGASFGIKSWIEGGVVALVILLNVVVGFFQEFKAEKTMDSLRSLSSPTANVVRDGSLENIPTREVVPGDIVELRTGDTIPADVRLIEAVNFETDEALLTGESLPVSKDAEVTFDIETGPGDRLNVAYSSSTVTKGRAKGVVYATGLYTEIGSIAAMLRAKNSRTRQVKRRPDGTASPHRYAQAWSLTLSDAIGRFLGINVGTPLQRKLSKIAIYLFFVAVVCAIIVLAANEFSSNQEVIIYAVATGLSMIPASLTVILTITMAAGTRQMVKRNVIVRKLDALEALGSITDICSDKTGTLTQGKMVVTKAWIPARGTYSIGMTNEPFNPTIGDIFHDEEAPTQLDKTSQEGDGMPSSYRAALTDNQDLLEFLKVASLANIARVHQADGEWKAYGDPTEIAIQVFASRFGWNRVSKTTGDLLEWKAIAEFPFDSDIKKMSVICENPSNKARMVFTKGAVERIIRSCSSIHLKPNDDPVLMTEEIRQEILDNMDSISKRGLRCLALASASYNGQDPNTVDVDRDEVERDLTFRGLIGLYDPPRPESAGAVQQCHEASIKVRMVTGDHPGTATAIAKQIGILPSNMDHLSRDVAKAMVMTAKEFDRLSDAQIDALPTLPLVIARCAPNTKVRMISALHRRGRFVAMTGDGVNDSPSLAKADIGIAMGLAGSDVAKDSAKIILTDDNLASILAAVQEGRRMAANIQKFLLHLLSQNVAQALVLLCALAFKDRSDLSVFPISPVEILWVIMITSGLPDMGLGFEPSDPKIMQRPPSAKGRIFTYELLLDMLFYGLLIAVLILGAFACVVWSPLGGTLENPLGVGCNASYSEQCHLVFQARGTAFTGLVFLSLLLAWTVRTPSPRSSVVVEVVKYPIRLWKNQFLFWSVIGGVISVIPVLYIPVISDKVFLHGGLGGPEWGVVAGVVVVWIVGVEAWRGAKKAVVGRDYAVEDIEVDAEKGTEKEILD